MLGVAGNPLVCRVVCRWPYPHWQVIQLACLVSSAHGHPQRSMAKIRGEGEVVEGAPPPRHAWSYISTIAKTAKPSSIKALPQGQRSRTSGGAPLRFQTSTPMACGSTAAHISTISENRQNPFRFAEIVPPRQRSVPLRMRQWFESEIRLQLNPPSAPTLVGPVAVTAP